MDYNDLYNKALSDYSQLFNPDINQKYADTQVYAKQIGNTIMDQLPNPNDLTSSESISNTLGLIPISRGIKLKNGLLNLLPKVEYPNIDKNKLLNDIDKLYFRNQSKLKKSELYNNLEKINDIRDYYAPDIFTNESKLSNALNQINQLKGNLLISNPSYDALNQINTLTNKLKSLPELEKYYTNDIRGNNYFDELINNKLLNSKLISDKIIDKSNEYVTRTDNTAKEISDNIIKGLLNKDKK